MNENKFKTTAVFSKNLQSYIDDFDIIINQGGTRSSKTYSILQLILLIAENAKENKIISIVSRTLPHLKMGAMRDFDNVLLSAGYIPDKIKNKTDHIYTVGKCMIEFFGADQLDKVHGPARNILFINEANFLKVDVYDQLAVRTTETIFIDFNPTQRFWIHDEIIPNNRHAFIHSTYKDNRFLTKQQIERIEAKQKNANWWAVYGRGEIGKLEGAVFINWRVGPFDETLPFGFGLDYGFYPDPDAMSKIAIDEKRKIIYAKECIYENSQGTDDLITAINRHVQRHNLIIAESATPRTNKDLQKHFNIKPVSKTKTVADWLRAMQDYEIVITEDSPNLEKELLNYMWSDKKAGIPVDAWNHLIDGIRYYYMNTRKSSAFW